jgi:hypothetical protein
LLREGKKQLYYLAALNSEGIEQACDFGFDMLERIMLDECFKALKNIPTDLIKEKRFCIYEDKPVLSRNQVIGMHAREICSRFGVYIGYDTCVATVLDGPSLYSLLYKLWIKIYNLPEWRCDNTPKVHGLFNSILVYDPSIMRKMLSEKKYGCWNHAADRKKGMQVLEKFISFLERGTPPASVVLYNEIFCSRWDATGELHIDTGGMVKEYKYFGEGKSLSYLYSPKVDVWQRV